MADSETPASATTAVPAPESAPTAPAEGGEVAVEEKKEEPKVEKAKKIFKHGYRRMEEGLADLLDAIKNCEEKRLREIIWAVPIQDRCEFVNQINAEGMTPVMLCVDIEQVDMLADLLDYGADPSALDFQRMTPLHYACIKNNKRAIKLLISQGADISIENNEYNKCHQMVKDTLAMQNHLNKCIDETKELLKEKRVIPCSRQQRAYIRSIYDIIDTRQQGRTRIDEVAPLLDIAMGGVLESPDIRYVVDWFRGLDIDKRGLLTFQDFILAVQTQMGGGGGAAGKKGKKGSKK